MSAARGVEVARGRKYQNACTRETIVVLGLTVPGRAGCNTPIYAKLVGKKGIEKGVTVAYTGEGTFHLCEAEGEDSGSTFVVYHPEGYVTDIRVSSYQFFTEKIEKRGERVPRFHLVRNKKK